MKMLKNKTMKTNNNRKKFDRFIRNPSTYLLKGALSLVVFLSQAIQVSNPIGHTPRVNVVFQGLVQGAAWMLLSPLRLNDPAMRLQIPVSI